MPIALESSAGSGGIGRPTSVRSISSCISVFETLGKVDGVAPRDDRRSQAGREDSDSCSSSIGTNSDSSGERIASPASDDEDSGDVQSSYKGPWDSMDALEDSLPIRRGISKFYNGKSKSFTSLADARSSPAKDLGKPENAYSRKRKNLLAHCNLLDKNRSYPLRNNGGGICKRPTNSGRSTLAIAVAMSSSETNLNDDHESRLPPLHPQGKPPMKGFSPPQGSFSSRSFSLTDLQAASASTSICLIDKHKRSN